MLHTFFKKNALLFFYTAIGLLAISDTGVQLLLLNLGIPNSRILRKIAICLLFCTVAQTRYTKKEFFLLLPLTFLSLYNYTICGDVYSIYNVLIIAGMKNINFSTLFKTLFYSTLLTLCLIGVLSFFGIGGDFSLTQDFGRGGIETRYCFGLYHPNLWHQAFAKIIVYFVLAYYTKIKWYTLFGLFLVNYIFFCFSISRTGLLTVSFFLAFVLLYKYAKKLLHKPFMKLSIFVSCLSSYFVFLYFLQNYALTHSALSRFVDSKFTTGRISQAYKFFLTHSVSLFGKTFIDDGTVFDCGFLRFFYTSGILIATLFFLALFWLLAAALKRNYDYVIPVIIFSILYGFYEADSLTRVPYNLVVFFIPIILYTQLQRQTVSTQS